MRRSQEMLLHLPHALIPLMTGVCSHGQRGAGLFPTPQRCAYVTRQQRLFSSRCVEYNAREAPVCITLAGGGMCCMQLWGKQALEVDCSHGAHLVQEYLQVDGIKPVRQARLRSRKMQTDDKRGAAAHCG